MGKAATLTLPCSVCGLKKRMIRGLGGVIASHKAKDVKPYGPRCEGSGKPPKKATAPGPYSGT